jgi:hypothetical protein
VLVVKVVVLDAELNSASNDDLSKGGGGHQAKRGGLDQNTVFFRIFLIYPVDIRS